MASDLASLLSGSAEDVAPRLLGAVLTRELDGETVRVKIVETEAYDQTDVASHSYRGETERTKVMFGPAGYLYVYFTYGMHYCCNVVTGPAGHGAAVLIRAVEPIEGEALLQINRKATGVNTTNGPAKLCQALGIDKHLNGHDLRRLPLRLELGDSITQESIMQTTRIGIAKGVDVPWRFYIRGNSWVSKV